MESFAGGGVDSRTESRWGVPGGVGVGCGIGASRAGFASLFLLGGGPLEYDQQCVKWPGNDDSPLLCDTLSALRPAFRD